MNLNNSIENYKIVRNEQGRSVLLPANCNHPLTKNVGVCFAVHPSHEECDCRWCVYNKEFCQAKQKEDRI